jgi:hypothetical protein
MSPRKALPHTYDRLAHDEPAAREVRRLFDAAVEVVTAGRRMEEVGTTPGRLAHLRWLIEQLEDVVDPRAPAPVAMLRLIQGGKS